MKALIVYSHSEPTSFTSSLKNVSIQTLEENGHQVTLSDLYAQGFHPTAEKFDFSIISGSSFNYMHEQKNAAMHSMAFAPDISDEIKKLKDADLIVFHFPLWWSSTPAILKGWIDRVFAMGVAWDSRGQVFSEGLLRGKQALVVTSTSEPGDNYQPTGLYKGTVEQMLHPLLYGTFAYCGMDVLKPFVAYDVLNKNNEQRSQMVDLYRDHLVTMIKTPQFYTKISGHSPLGDLA